MTLDRISAEIEIWKQKDGAVLGWRFSLFLDEVLVAEGLGPTVPVAAGWCAHHLRTNLERGLSALSSMGFDISPKGV